MKGEAVKKILQDNGFQLIDVAKAMGETKQNLNSMLLTQDIKTSVLERIATAVNKNVYFFLSGGDDMPMVATVIGDAEPENITIPREVWSVIQNQAASLMTKDEQVSEVISMLKEQMKKGVVSTGRKSAAAM